MKLKTLRRIIEEVFETKDPKQCLDLIVKRVREAMNTGACSILLFDQRRRQYVLTATDGLNTEVVGRLRIGMQQGLVGMVGEREEPINVADVTQHPNYYLSQDAQEQRFHSFLGVPIIYRRHLLGVLAVQQRQARKYDEEEEAFLVTLSTQLAPVIARVEISSVSSSASRRRDEANYQGIGSSTGVAIGTAVTVYPQADLSVVPDRKIDDITVEINAFELAIEEVREDVAKMRNRFATRLPPAEQILFDAYLGILDSNSLGAEVVAAIEQGNWAQGALRQVITQRVRQFKDMDDEYISERGDDIKDLGQRILANLQKKQKDDIDYPDKTILVGDQLTAAELMQAPKEKLVAVVSRQGSVNAHVAILAKALGIPAVMGAGSVNLTEIADKQVIVDGYYGHIYIDPSEDIRQEFIYLAQEEKELDDSLTKLRDLPAETIDGTRVKLWVNAGLDADSNLPFEVGAQGVGLYRTEVPFMARERFPSEQEQYVLYRKLLAAHAPNPVTMRTLDIGGDKALSYFPINEDNAFLGWRGIRVMLDQTDIFMTQLRAMLRANKGLNNLRIMFPMISHIREFEEAISIVHEEHEELQADDPEIILPPLGLMLEVPSAVYHAREFARRADFFSIGSNDLAQYLLAVDRNNNRVADLYDTLHPVVIGAIRQAVKSGHRAGKMVSVCGEMAGDPLAVILLLAMEIDALSSNAINLPRIKWVIRRFSLEQAKQLLRDVSIMENAQDIRAHLSLAIERAGLGGLIRAGKY